MGLKIIYFLGDYTFRLFDLRFYFSEDLAQDSRDTENGKSVVRALWRLNYFLFIIFRNY